MVVSFLENAEDDFLIVSHYVAKNPDLQSELYLENFLNL